MRSIVQFFSSVDIRWFYMSPLFRRCITWTLSTIILCIFSVPVAYGASQTLIISSAPATLDQHGENGIEVEFSCPYFLHLGGVIFYFVAVSVFAIHHTDFFLFCRYTTMSNDTAVQIRRRLVDCHSFLL